MSRQKPWRAEHPDAVIVARPSRWGNPWSLSDWAWVSKSTADKRGLAVDCFRRMLIERRDYNFPSTVRFHGYPSDQEIRWALAGQDLACWCPLDQPCHADVLLELANGDSNA